MKKTILAVLLVITILVIYILNLFLTTGFFRKIENKFEGQVVKEIPVPGAEDLAISYEDHFILVSSDDRAAGRHGRPHRGGIYKIDLRQDPFSAKLISESFRDAFFPHGISMIRLDSAVYKVYVINHVAKAGAGNVMDHTGKEHSIEVFRLEGDRLTHLETLKDPSIKSPNDLVAVDERRFYFTNDHGADSRLGVLAENYLGRALSNVVYFDGKDYREVAGGIAYANGINYDRERNLLFVASPRDFMVKVYEVRENGELDFIENIDCGTGVDNIEFDREGRLWIGAHPDLLHFSAYAAGKKEKAPSELITVEYRSAGDYDVRSIYTNDGSAMSGSSVATPYGKYIYAGNVMDDHFLVLEPN
jgi:arylesterase/paraoxonase